MARHVQHIGSQQILGKEGVLRVAWDRLDEVLFVNRGVKGLGCS